MRVLLQSGKHMPQTPMFDSRFVAFIATTAILIFGTTYSVLYGTYMDTSDPLLSSLPHPLQSTHYFSGKSNFLNVYFIKMSWGWTSAAFFMLLLSSAPYYPRARERVTKWFIATSSWMLFTSWFFGPSVIERLAVATGGECIVALPDSSTYVTVPQQYCYTKSTVSPSTHPELFVSQLAPALHHTGWASAMPRLRRGHDISGHIFLLTMSILFLSDQLRSRYQAKSYSIAQRLATGLGSLLIAIWLFSIYTTGVYFHTPFEKVTGFFLGVASFAVTQLPAFNQMVASEYKLNADKSSAEVKAHSE